MTAIPASAARMAVDGDLMMGGAKLERAATVLPFGDRGPGERNLVTFLRLGSSFNEEPWEWFDIVDEIEVQKKTKLVVYVALVPDKSHLSPPPPGHCM